MKRPLFIGGVAVLSAAVAVGLLFVFSDFLGFLSTDTNGEQVVAGPESDGPAEARVSENQLGLAEAPVPASGATPSKMEDADSPADAPADELAGRAASEGLIPGSPEGGLAVAPVGRPGGHVVAGAVAGPDGAGGGQVAGSNKPEEPAMADAVDRPLAGPRGAVVALPPGPAGVKPPGLAEETSQLAGAPVGGAGFVAPRNEPSEAESGFIAPALASDPAPGPAAVETQVGVTSADGAVLGPELVGKPAVSDDPEALLAGEELEGAVPSGEVTTDVAALDDPEAAPTLESRSGSTEAEFDSVVPALVDQPPLDAGAVETQRDVASAEKKLSLGAELAEKPAPSGDTDGALLVDAEPEGALPAGEVVDDVAALAKAEVAPTLESRSGPEEAGSGSIASALVDQPSPDAVAVETQRDVASAEKLPLGSELAEKPVVSGNTEGALLADEEPEGAPPGGEVVADVATLAGSGGTPVLEPRNPVSSAAAESTIVTTMAAEGSAGQPLRAGAELDPATVGAGVVDQPVSSGNLADAIKLGADAVALTAAPQVAAAPATAAIDAPEFDVVRVDRFGNSVIAGRSSPSCEITVHDESEVIGVVTADGRGEWVLLPVEPLRPGDRQLSLSADCGSAGHADSERLVIVVVPEPGSDIAGRPTDEPADVLALSVPRSGNGATRVLQVPIAQGAEQVAGRVLPAVSLNAIDYGPDGKLSLSGEAEPGAALNVYLDNALVGSASTDPEGRWVLTPEAPVAPGLYTLRADQLADTGKVEARVELPFLRAALLTDLPDDRFVVVQPGNSLWRLARRTYGRGIQFTVIFQANADQIRDPDLIYPGQIFMLPPTN